MKTMLPDCMDFSRRKLLLSGGAFAGTAVLGRSGLVWAEDETTADYTLTIAAAVAACVLLAR